jgi:hypothetical protein
MKKDMVKMRRKSLETIELYKNSNYDKFNDSRVTSKSQYRKSYEILKNNNVFQPLFTPSKSFNVFENIKSIQGMGAREPKRIKI